MLTVSNQVSTKVDLITFLITSEPSPDTQTLEKAQAGDVSISLVCCGAAARVRAAVIVSRCYGRPLFPGSVCVCVQWLWWPIQSPENRQQVCTGWDMLAKQTGGPSGAGKPDSQCAVCIIFQKRREKMSLNRFILQKFNFVLFHKFTIACLNPGEHLISELFTLKSQQVQGDTFCVAA